jgi:2-oxoglutarate ferredoxin oxidoreductase subunit gamma
MHEGVVFAGFGGQGVLLIGKILAYAGMKQGKEVSWFPSYGPEMRGGTANCTVVISDRTVGSPVVEHPHSLVAMNLPSLDKFEPKVKQGGLVLVNSSLIPKEVQRRDVRVLRVPANDIAIELDNPKGANMVALGAYIGATRSVDFDLAAQVVAENFAAKPKLVDVNLEALRRGYALGEAARQGGAA